MRICFKSSSIPLVHSLNLFPLPSYSPSNVNVQIVISILCKSHMELQKVNTLGRLMKR
jgi:hypothetical protein